MTDHSRQKMTGMCAGIAAGALFFMLSIFSGLNVHAEELTGDGHPYDAAAEEERTRIPVQTNEISGWPSGPTVTAGSAILMDVKTGTVLYAKNIHEKMYPASTTKLLTCLIAVEHLSLDDTVEFSENAVNSVPSDGSNIGIQPGESMSVEECLYGILVGSANECANAIAEKTAGSISAFADMMNEKAQELGCTDSHFANANGLFDENHYTSAHDLCLIGKAFFSNDTLIRIGNTAQHHFTATATQPDDFWITNKHKLISGEYTYSGIIGGKTGYTSQSKETLVTGCERGGKRLVCVVMMEDDPKQFTDTMSLFDYGYSDFSYLNIADNDTKLQITQPLYLSSGTDTLGSSSAAFSLSDNSWADVPVNSLFSDLSASADNGTVTYKFGDTSDAPTVGTAELLTNISTRYSGQSRDNIFSRIRKVYYQKGARGTHYISISSLAITGSAAAALILLVILTRTAIASHRRRMRRRRRYRRRYR